MSLRPHITNLFSVAVVFAVLGLGIPGSQGDDDPEMPKATKKSSLTELKKQKQAAAEAARAEKKAQWAAKKLGGAAASTTTTTAVGAAATPTVSATAIASASQGFVALPFPSSAGLSFLGGGFNGQTAAGSFGSPPTTSGTTTSTSGAVGTDANTTGASPTCTAAATTTPAAASAAAAASPGMYNSKILEFAVSHLGTQVGNGECWTLVASALNFAGARPPNMYVFGDVIQVQAATSGDIIQFESALFTGSNYWIQMGAPHHSAIVYSLTGSRLTLLNQNVNGSRVVQYSVVDLNDYKSGTITAYRAVSP